MKIDRTKLKKSSTEVPTDCKVLIDKLKACNGVESELYKELKQVTSWTFGKCELYHWADVLDTFDDVLDKATRKERENKWTLACDLPLNSELKELMVHVLQFTALLIEHSFSRHLYNSMEHLTTLLSSCDMAVVLEVLNLLYVFSKRSNFITRLTADKKQGLVVRLTHLAESWGGKENGFGLAECCKTQPLSAYPSSATTLHFEFYAENKDDKSGKKGSSNIITCIHMENLDKANKLSSEIMEEILEQFKIPEDKHMLLYTHIRLAQSFALPKARVQSVQARLQSLSILVYSSAIQESINTLLYNGLIEELVDVIELPDNNLVEIKAAALRTLTSIVHLDRNPKLNAIIDATGASSYHGFLPVLVRTCIQHMTDPELAPFPQPFATALFSFLYHLASYENGGEALVSCGMMEPLLKVINWYGEGQEHITFVTRAVRVVDLITNLDMAAFQTHTGLTAFINRLEHEVGLCRREQPFVIRIRRRQSSSTDLPPESPPQVAMETDPSSPNNDKNRMNAGASPLAGDLPDYSASKTGLQCFPQRAALLKSMLNFLKKAIPDAAFAESIRHLMEGSLPSSLKHIISNAEYYGPSLFLLATDVVTVYVFQEPSLLSSLQDNGLTDVVLHALLIKDVPATREVLASLPNVFSALCLNVRGLESFVQCRPFDRLFKVLLSPDYLPAMRRRRSSDPLGDTASNLGNAMDELMRHQPSLRTDATKAIIKLLEEVCAMGKDPKYVCQKPQPKAEQAGQVTLRSPQPADTGSSDEEEEEDDVSSNASHSSSAKQENTPASGSTPERQAIPLMDYVLNVMKFVESILSNNTTDDHCREFVSQKGLLPLMGILGLPNLPIDFPASPACQAVASVCKAILMLSREPQVLKQGLLHLNEVLQELEPLHKPLEAPGGSVLLKELAGASQLTDPTLSPQSTPLLHSLSATHAYIMMFAHVCRMGQTDIRTISVSHWGSELGLQVLRGLSSLYTSLVWESTVLLALCSEEILPSDSEFGKEDIEKLMPKDMKTDKDAKKEGGESLTRSVGELGSNGVSAAMESLTTAEVSETAMEVDATNSADKNAKKSIISPSLQALIKQIKPLLSASSRLGRVLAELFGLLVKLCVGTPVRQRRSHQLPSAPTTPTPAAQQVASALTKLLANGLNWKPPDYSPVPKLRLTFLVCSVGFTSPMLFDEKKQPYHLMLQKFLTSGGQDAFFQAFHWALSIGGTISPDEGLENPNLPDGTGEFLDAWLMLVEKMVNPKTVLESPHTLPTKSTQPGFVPFDPVQYLIRTQKAAFNAVMHLWNKKPLKIYGSRMSESILAILCHIIKGETIIMEKLQKEKETSSTGETTSTAAPATNSTLPNNVAPVSQRRADPEVNADDLQQLMDMGFSRAHCTDALSHTANLEQATDYILTHPPPALQVPGIAGMELDLDEEDQMMRAIAMSLGENVVMSTDQPTPQNNEQQSKKEDSKTEDETVVVLTKEDPIEKSVLDKFTTDVLPGCLQLLDSIPETVYRVCDLFVIVSNRNGPDWRNAALKTVVQQIYSYGEKLLERMKSMRQADAKELQEAAKNLTASDEGAKFSTRLHILALLFEEMMMPCAAAVESNNIVDILVYVLYGHQFIANAKDIPSQKWLGPLLLLIDLYEKVSVTFERKADVQVLMNKTTHSWRWLDDRSGKWNHYNSSNSKTIHDAYVAGETSVRFSAGRRRYTVNFSTMVQINEETANRRPIMLLPNKEETETEKPKEDQQKTEDKNPKDEKAPSAETKMETDSSSNIGPKKEKIIAGLTSEHASSIIRSVVSLIGIPVEPDTLHAALRLTLRLTRNHQYAMLFAQLGGPKLLLNLTQASTFQGVASITTLIFRHVIEEKLTLRHCMWKVMKSATSGSGSSVTGVTQGSQGSQELHYVLRVLGPAAGRESELFTEVAQETLRISMIPTLKRGEELRYAGPNTPQILGTTRPKQPAPVTVDDTVKEVLGDLLSALVAKHVQTPDEANPNSVEVLPAQTLAEAIQEVVNEVNREISDQQQIARQTTDTEETQDESADTGEGSSVKTEDNKVKDAKTAEELRKQKPLLPKSAILRLLSEIIKSYSNCSKFITQHTYQSGDSDLVIEDCNVLAYVLDNLLPQCQSAGDRDCPALSRVFIASIASCHHSPDAQAVLVSEVKAALQRALCMPESLEKHSKLQAYFGIITVMIESCPSPGQIPNQVFKGQQSLMNSIVKLLLKRGLVTDLARVPHSLDLSSPYMANTVNAALKPLENLSRIVNQPQNMKTVKPPLAVDVLANQGFGSQGAVNNPPSEVTARLEEPEGENEQGDVTIEDVSDQIEANQDLEETEASEAIEPEMDSQTQVESELDDVLGQLLERNENEDVESRVLGEIIMETGDVSHSLRSESDDIDHHDSQMITQEISEEHSQSRYLHDDDDSGASGSDDDDDDNGDDHECDDDDDDDDDDDEECEEDEGSDMEADEEDYEGINMDNLAPGYNDDFFLHIEDVLPPAVGQPFVLEAPDRTYQLPAHDTENGNSDGALPAIPPAPSSVSSSHPLLVRQAEPHAVLGTIAARVHRSGRSRGTYRFNPSTQTLHVNFTTGPGGIRHPNPPVILQRLLGPSTAADVLQLTNSFSTQTPNAHTRVVLAREGMPPDDDIFEELFQDNYNTETGSVGSGVLSCIPTTLTRWTEEAKVLDGDSVHNLVTVLKPKIIDVLEKHKEEVLAERQEKKKKADEEAASNKEAEGQRVTGEQSSLESRMRIELESSLAANSPFSWVNLTPGDDSQVSTTIGHENSGTTTTVSVGSSSNPPDPTTPATRPPANNQQFSDREAVAAAERLAEAMVEEELSGCTTSTPMPSTVTSTSTTATSTNNPPVLAIASSVNPPKPEESLTVPAPQESDAPMPSPIVARVSTNEDSDVSESRVTTDGLSETPMEVSNLVSLLLSEDDDLTALGNLPPMPPVSLPVSLQRPVLPPVPPADAATAGDTVITPEESSNITSSDAVTVHSSGSGSTEEWSCAGNSSAADLSNASTVISVPTSQMISSLTQSLPTPASLTDGSSAAAPSPLTPGQRPGPSNMFGEGVDPSFLAALPDNIRQEVIAEQLRLQGIQQRAQQQAQSAENSGAIEVNPEFLAALPPSIQEEVLSQQRAEQARLSASQGTSNPEAPVDPAGFIASLPTSLRQQVLSDMDDSMVAVLPADLAAEAQTLRRELEERHRRLVHERLFTQAGAGSLSAILRHTGLASRLGNRYAIRAAPRSGNQWCFGNSRAGQSSNSANNVRLRGRHLLDHEALTCLLVLLFVEEPKLNTGRLHRVLRNLCYHGPTRIWVVRALLSILQRTGGENPTDNTEGSGSVTAKTSDKSKRKSQGSDTATQTQQPAMQVDSAVTIKTDSKNQCSWLSISLEAALGCRANVFQIQKVGKKHAANSTSAVTIHPQASPVVCRHVLDTLISLAKSFPFQFLPSSKAKEVVRCEGEKEGESAKQKVTAAPSSPKGLKMDIKPESKESSKETRADTDFWDLLVKLDSQGSARKGKGVQRSHSSSLQEPETEMNTFDSSPVGPLMSMLSHPVVRRSQLLTDRLLRLLGLVSIGLPDVTQRVLNQTSAPPTSTTATVTTTSTARGITTTTSSMTPLIIPSVQPSGDSTKPETPPNQGAKAIEEKPKEIVEPPAILETQLPLAVKVLTSKACSEEGLEDATSLLLQLSRANNATRTAILNLLLGGGRELGFTVCSHIRTLMAELKNVIAKFKESQGDDDKEADTPLSYPGKGVLVDRFTTGGSVVVAAPSKVKSVRELQLPSMSALTSKTSSQQFFLRILKVIIQLRDAAREAAKKSRRLDNMQASNLAEEIENLDTETIMDIVGRRERLSSLASDLLESVSIPVSNQPNSSTHSVVVASAPPVPPPLPNDSDSSLPPPPPPDVPAEGSSVDGPSVPVTDQASAPQTRPPTRAPLPHPVVGLVDVLRQGAAVLNQGAAFVRPRLSAHQPSQPSPEAPMEVDQAESSGSEKKVNKLEESVIVLPRLSDQLELDELWETLGDCLTELAKMPDHHAVLILQPAVEAFFLVHAGEKDGLKKRDNTQQQQRREDQFAHLNVEVAAPTSPSPAGNSEIDQTPLLSRENSAMSVSSMSNLPADTQKFLKFAETHRTVLNQILRQSTMPLADGPFSVLVDHTRILDFDVKRRYFRQELERLDEGMRREDLPVHVKREHVFEDSFRELHRRSSEEWKHRFYIVFEGEEGQDAGGLLREWYMIISREIFNPMYALFKTSPGDRVTYTINPSSHCNSNHLSYYKFVGRIIAKAIYDNKLLECYFTRSFYKHIIGQAVKVNDMESEDFSFYQGLIFLIENNVRDLGYELMFSTEIQEFGVTESRDLKPNGRNIAVTEENKREYVRLVCQMRMTGAIRQQLNSFLEGFYDIIPQRLISIFNEQELELLISGLPTIDIDDLKANTEYHKYQTTSLQIQWFWRALRSFDQADRARFIQFVTGTSKVPLQGFAFLEGMNGTQKFQIHRDDRSTDRLPSAHTCFNQLDLPAYETFDKLKHMLLMAVNECSEGFGLA